MKRTPALPCPDRKTAATSLTGDFTRAPGVHGFLHRTEGVYAFPPSFRRVMGFNELGLWVDDVNGSTGIIRPCRAV